MGGVRATTISYGGESREQEADPSAPPGTGSHSPGPIGHKLLAAEDDEHVDAGQVEDPCPVFEHPVPGILMDELILKVEHKRVVGRDFYIHFQAAAGFD